MVVIMVFKFFGFMSFFILIIGFCYIIRQLIDLICNLNSIRKLNKDLKKLERKVDVKNE